MKKVMILMGICLNMALASLAETSPSIASYSIPANAVKLGPLPIKGNGMTRYAYIAPGVENRRENWLATEIYFRDTLVERGLFKDGKKHGIQREWYHNGQLKSESPYNMSSMDGTFKQWDEKGQLVAHYEMSHGSGKIAIYHSNGVLWTEENIERNQRNGKLVTLFPSKQIDYIGEFRDGRATGLGLGFYESGTLNYVAWANGPLIYFEENGDVESRKWRIQGKAVSEVEYANAASLDKTLPPYYADAQRYKKLVAPEIKATLKKYRAMPKVRIPLESDAQGNPLLAP